MFYVLLYLMGITYYLIQYYNTKFPMNVEATKEKISFASKDTKTAIKLLSGNIIL